MVKILTGTPPSRHQVYTDSRPEISRRQFLRADLRGKTQAVRPPWALPEARFIETCERCDDCISACPEKILRRGNGGYPQLDFAAGGCTFCGDCARVCEYGALGFADDPQQMPWRLEVAIVASCLSLHGTVCRSCGEVCEERAIRFKLEVGGIARPLLDTGECNGCGQCVSVCPVGSIRIGPAEAVAQTQPEKTLGDQSAT